MNQSDQFVDIDPTQVPAELDMAPVRFVVCETYPSFIAEVAVIGEDFVFHFYLPKSGVQDYAWYWEKYFPDKLDVTAREHFKVEYPRLKAMHVNDLGIDSWWMRAYGFAAQVMDADVFVQRLYEKLHQALTIRK